MPGFNRVNGLQMADVGLDMYIYAFMELLLEMFNACSQLDFCWRNKFKPVLAE